MNGYVEMQIWYTKKPTTLWGYPTPSWTAHIGNPVVPLEDRTLRVEKIVTRECVMHVGHGR